MWGASDKFLPLLHQHWNKELPGTHMFKLAKKLKLLKPVFKELNKDRYNDIEVNTEAMEQKVRMMQEELGVDPTNKHLMDEEYNVLQELNDLMEARASFLAQKSKQQWIQEGDTSSAFFHGIIKGRRNGSTVIMIEDMKGKMWDSPEAIKGAFLEFYQQLIGRRQGTSRVHRRIMDHGPRCTEDMTRSLMIPVTGKEIRDTIFSIPDTKSPRPYGYTSKFYKDAWNVIGDDVIAAVKDFFSHRKLLTQLNATNLVLIPKTDKPSSVQLLRPKACCNVIYKVISKILCSWLPFSHTLLIGTKGPLLKAGTFKIIS
ncbi:hypothetical protein vseg_013350 [Gypsophila vaccaria]